MRTTLRTAFVVASLTLGACVTINIYFPEAAAERAADQIIDDVWGTDPGSEAPAPPQSQTPNALRALVVALVTGFVSDAHAASGDIDVSTPAIDRLKSSMQARHRQLEAFYDAGAVGVTANGLVDVRDLKAVPLKDRTKLQALVAAENSDRDALYREIARANGHPEWEADIRSTFARRWIDRAARGWWVNDGSGWRQR